MARKRKRGLSNVDAKICDLKRARKGGLAKDPKGSKSATKYPREPISVTNKRAGKEQDAQTRGDSPFTINHPVLSHYFRTLVPLRIWLLHSLAKRSESSVEAKSKYARLLAYTSDGSTLQDDVANILDTSIIGYPRKISLQTISLAELTGLEDEVVIGPQIRDGLECSQSELVGRILNKLFIKTKDWKMRSILTLGYSESSHNLRLEAHGEMQFGANVVSTYPNVYVTMLRGAAWSIIMALVGEEIAFELLTMQGFSEGGIFLPVAKSADEGNITQCYHQMSGSAISEISPEDMLKRRQLDTLVQQQDQKSLPHKDSDKTTTDPKIQPPALDQKYKQDRGDLHKPTTIKFVKTRIFYAKPAVNAVGEVKFGLRHIHALNRFDNPKLRAHKVRMLKYMFPREFGLHNVFTGTVNAKEHVQPFLDYTLREQEIISKLRRDKKLGKVRERVTMSVSFTEEAEQRAPSHADPDDTLILPEEPEEPEVFNLDNCANGIAAGNAARHAAKVKAKAAKNTKAEQLKADVEAAERLENLPKRLRGNVLELVGKLITRQKACSYDALVKHYCPVIGLEKDTIDKRPTLPEEVPLRKRPRASLDLKSQFSSSAKRKSFDRRSIQSTDFVQLNPAAVVESETTIPGQDRLIEFASSTGEVSAFVGAVIKRVIPAGFWGEGETGDKNLQKILAKIDHFVKLRRAEGMAIHDVLQDLKIADFKWIAPDSKSPKCLSPSDFAKRKSLLSEFLYYLFDSFIIPLLRAHFYITESSTHSMRVFYFRHDIWRTLTEPKMTQLKSTHFEELKTKGAKRILEARSLSFGLVRFLPKEKGLRIITNLKKRERGVNPKTGKVFLHASINYELGPVKSALKYERIMQPESLGGSLFSIGDIYPKLKAFKDRLINDGILGKQKLYFAKVDITAAFDTIPQKAALTVVQGLLAQDEYKIEKRCEISSSGEKNPRRKWRQPSKPADEFLDMDERAEEWLVGGAATKKHTVFVDKIVPQFHDTSWMQDLLQEHICNNIVKIGKKFYHQKTGIPQGSVLSTMMCNVFYADLEAKHLEFTREPTGVLLRLIDDFLFITLSRKNAVRFLDVMTGGLPEYGAVVKLEKSLVNFETRIHNQLVKRVLGSDGGFPYCGVSVCEKTLDVKREGPRKMETKVADTMTVDYVASVGMNMQRKIVNGFRIQAQAMYFDTSFNTRNTVFGNIFVSFCNVATRVYRYSRSLNVKDAHVNERVIIKIIDELIEMIVIKIKECLKKAQTAGTNGQVINRAQIKWLAATAFKRVLVRKQTLFKCVLAWLEQTLRSTQVDRACRRVVKSASISTAFEGVRY